MTNRRWGVDGATYILAETLHIEYVLVSVQFIGDPRKVSLQAMKVCVQ